MQWYFVDKGQRRGPFSDEEFSRMVRMGVIVPDSLVWREGLQHWQAFKDLLHYKDNDHDASLQNCASCLAAFPRGALVRIGNAAVCGACKQTYLERIREGDLFIPGGELAGIFARAGARLLDMAVLGVFFSAAYWLMFGTAEDSDAAMFAASALLNIGMIFVTVAYEGFFVAHYDATPGKLALGLRVLRSNRARLTPARALGRALASTLSVSFCYIGFLPALLDDERRTLHDFLCDTRVVREPLP